MLRVRPISLQQVEYLAAMEDDHLLCMQVSYVASETDQPAASGIPGCHGRRSLIVQCAKLCMQVFCGASEADQPEVGGIPGCHGRRSLIVHAGILWCEWGRPVLNRLEDGHLLCMQVFCGASEASQTEAGGILGCHGTRKTITYCIQVFCGASEAGRPEAGGISGCHGRRSLIVHTGILWCEWGRPACSKWMPWKTITYCACRYSVVRVRPTSLKQVEYLAAMEDDHFEFWTEPGLNRYKHKHKLFFPIISWWYYVFICYQD